MIEGSFTVFPNEINESRGLGALNMTELNCAAGDKRLLLFVPGFFVGYCT